jgi:integrase
MNRIYNEEIKEKFLSQYDNEQTQKTIRNLFFNTFLIENTLGKDLFEQNLTELGKSIENSNPATKNVARSNGRFISNYLSWAAENGYKSSNINVLKSVLPEWYDQFVDKTRKIHFSYDEFIDLIGKLENSQDISMLCLFWHGIIGEKFSQLQQLEYKDIDFKNKTIYVKERDYHVPVTDECLKYLEKAYNEKTYYQYNKDSKEYSEKVLLDSNFLLKNLKSPRAQQENQPVSMSVLYNRIHNVKDMLQLEALTPNSLKQSGMIKMAVDLYNQEGSLGYDQFAKIGEKYDFSMIENNGYKYYNTYLMREFISEENISDLYGIEVEITKK